ncbi:platelet-activating factor acetylhydrolase, isoform II-domain-containing protein [Amylocystis lapponica]|nr:platelet-activating factor acetylhydrolase, isoform II-domain-containing protein [Amylocystis lapponica]
MFYLPDVPGRYPVGATTFASSLHAARTIGLSRLSSTPHKPALTLEETVFTAYYPADTGDVESSPGSAAKKAEPTKGMNWLVRPAREVLRGYAHFGQMSSWVVHRFLGPYASRLKIPVYQNAPLLDPTTPDKDPGAQWPLVLLSHGLCGTRTTYSQLCARLAAEGRVVLAVEHRDGTGPAVMPPSYSHRRAKRQKNNQPKGKYYLIPEKDIVWENGYEPEPFAFRKDQLVFRRLEMYIAYSMFSELVCAPPTVDSSIFGPLYTVDGPQPENLEDAPFWKSWISSPPRVQCTRDVSLVGHSFGGATVLSILSNPSPELPPESTGSAPTPHFAALPVRRAVEFTMWTDHFARLQDVVRLWRHDVAVTPGAAADADGEGGAGALLTLVRAKHVSFSDFGALPGHSPKTGRRLLDAVGALTLAFCGGHVEDGLRDAQLQRRKMQLELVGRHRSTGPWRLVGEVGDVIVH